MEEYFNSFVRSVDQASDYFDYDAFIRSDVNRAQDVLRRYLKEIREYNYTIEEWEAAKKRLLATEDTYKIRFVLWRNPTGVLALNHMFI